MNFCSQIRHQLNLTAHAQFMFTFFMRCLRMEEDLLVDLFICSLPTVLTVESQDAAYSILANVRSAILTKGGVTRHANQRRLLATIQPLSRFSRCCISPTQLQDYWKRQEPLSTLNSHPVSTLEEVIQLSLDLAICTSRAASASPPSTPSPVKSDIPKAEACGCRIVYSREELLGLKSSTKGYKHPNLSLLHVDCIPRSGLPKKKLSACDFLSSTDASHVWTQDEIQRFCRYRGGASDSRPATGTSSLKNGNSQSEMRYDPKNSYHNKDASWLSRCEVVDRWEHDLYQP